ncbi:Kinesin- motor protein [Maudiozyma exigua]|uniref:Kinesin- motor protein n=1 Tax=Maudiozyma exigua TaxID=34358 RepID=A0A9P7B720_MAUEX|nr:Kinesin- motor protein [Kazachstania exigua]
MSFQRRSASSTNRSVKTSTPSTIRRDARRRTVSGSTTNGSSNRTKSVSYSNNTQKNMTNNNELSSNIQVYVRCRSRNQREIDEKSSVVISTMGPNGKEVMLSSPTSSGSLSYPKKTYMFDQVFGAESDQNLVFDVTTKNYIQEMMDGYNCTVFAYGQTGTGKTYTMSGDINILGDVESQDKILLGEHAGIIPRVLVDLFQRLPNETNNDYSVKVSFLELYNEKLTDLLASGESEEETIRIFDNNNSNGNNHMHQGNMNSMTKNGTISSTSTGSSISGQKSKSHNNNSSSNHHSSSHDSNNMSNSHHPKVNNKNISNSAIIVKGMEEIYIKSAYEGLQLLTEGSLKRKVAATKCNDLSSRSHTIFTITTHITKTDPISGEQYVKIGKLNLVDLAGSENINRSGAENIRAQEAGLINKSLLTLGRVINALVDYSQHVPYRESKLTRLLQDSLGGRTKTCIIATISPAKISSEETVSTLEYATRAKSIKNTPQVNQSMSKDVCLNEYVHEIERLRHELRTSRQKDGIYVSQDQYDLFESNEILLQEQKMRIHNMEEQTTRFKQEYVKQTAISKDLELKLKDSETTIQGLQDQKLKLMDVFASYETSNKEFIKEAQEVHTINLTLMEKISTERDNYYTESKDYYTQILSTNNIITEQKKRLDDLEHNIREYNNRFNAIITEFHHNLSEDTIALKENIHKETDINFDDLSTSFTNTATVIYSQLAQLTEKKENMISDPYKAHRVIIESCLRDITKSLDNYQQILETQNNDTSVQVIDNLGRLNSEIMKDSDLTSQIIIRQRQKLLMLENKIQDERKHSTLLNEKLDTLTKYFDEYITKEKNNLYEILSDTFQTFRMKQAELDKHFLHKTKSEIVLLQQNNNENLNKHLGSFKRGSIEAFDHVSTRISNNKSHINELINKNGIEISKSIAQIPIQSAFEEIQTKLNSSCSTETSQGLYQLLTDLRDESQKSNIYTTNLIKQNIDSIGNSIVEDNNLKRAAFDNVELEVDQFEVKINEEYQKRTQNITNNQTKELSAYSDSIGNTANILSKNIRASTLGNSEEDNGTVTAVKMSTLPRFKKPSNYSLYDDLKCNNNKDFTNFEGLSLDNISPVHLSLSTIKYNPSTPVPVPDQPLPLPKVLMPRSVNTKATRSGTVPAILKQSSSRVTSPLKPNNLKRRFTLEPVDGALLEEESKENRPPIESGFDIKKVRLDPDMPELKGEENK